MVLADGCFDPLHIGHIDYLEAAARYGPLYVRVAPDNAILDKGRKPFQTTIERAFTVKALKCVDRAGWSVSLAQSIRQLKPSHLVKGIDWKDRLPQDVVDACNEVGTEIVFVNTQSRSSRERLAS